MTDLGGVLAQPAIRKIVERHKKMSGVRLSRYMVASLLAGSDHGKSTRCRQEPIEFIVVDLCMKRVLVPARLRCDAD